MGLSRRIAPQFSERADQARAVFVCWSFASLLLIAAGLKVESLGNSNSPASAGDLPSILKITAILAECSMAAWLFSGHEPVMARKAALSLLIIFIAVAGWRFASRSNDCGCFGRVKIPPVWSAVIDITALIGFLATRGVPAAALRGRSCRVAGAAIGSVAFGMPILVMSMLHPYVIAAGITNRDLNDPTLWIGKPLPLLKNLDLADQQALVGGCYTAIVVDSACPKCKAAMQNLPKSQTLPLARTLAIIDLNEAAIASPNYFTTGGTLLLGGIPIILDIDHGIVTRVEPVADESADRKGDYDALVFSR